MACRTKSRISLTRPESPPSRARPRNEVGFPSALATLSQDWSRWAKCSWARSSPLRSRTTTPDQPATPAISAELPAGRLEARRPWPQAWCRSRSGHSSGVRWCVRHRSAALPGSNLPSDCCRSVGRWRSRRPQITSACLPRPQLTSPSRGNPLDSSRMASQRRRSRLLWTAIRSRHGLLRPIEAGFPSFRGPSPADTMDQRAAGRLQQAPKA